MNVYSISEIFGNGRVPMSVAAYAKYRTKIVVNCLECMIYGIYWKSCIMRLKILTEVGNNIKTTNEKNASFTTKTEKKTSNILRMNLYKSLPLSISTQATDSSRRRLMYFK